MSNLDWLLHSFEELGVDVPPAFVDWLGTGEQELGGWYLLDERAAGANRRALNGPNAHSPLSASDQLRPSRVVLPFARRGDGDDVACLVLHDSEHPRGSVLVIHEGAMPGYEVEEVIDTVAQWFERAREEAPHPAGRVHRAPFGV